MTDAQPSETADFLRKRDTWIRTLVTDDSLSHPTVRVGVHIAMRTDGRDASRGAWPSIDTIAKSTGVSPRAVLYALSQLEGFTDKKQPGRKCGYAYLTVKRRRNVGNVYWLNFFWE